MLLIDGAKYEEWETLKKKSKNFIRWFRGALQGNSSVKIPLNY